jgi:hypothetical protein
MTEVSHEVDGIDFNCTVTCDPGTAASFVAATVKCYAANIATGAVYGGAAVIVSALVIRCTWGGGTLPVGQYAVQVIGTPVGYAPQTIFEAQWQIQKSLGPA